jgi:hypothetical protein
VPCGAATGLPARDELAAELGRRKPAGVTERGRYGQGPHVEPAFGTHSSLVPVMALVGQKWVLGMQLGGGPRIAARSSGSGGRALAGGMNRWHPWLPWRRQPVSLMAAASSWRGADDG